MAKVKVEVLEAVVDGKGQGEQISIEEKTADKLEKNGYVKRVEAKKSNQSKDKE